MADIIKKVNALGLLDQYTIAKSLGQEDEFCKSFGINIEKAEGSRGGKVIGHTKSGKPIYETSDHPGHANFTSEDHLNAAQHHWKLSNQHEDNYDPHFKMTGEAMAHSGEGYRHSLLHTAALKKEKKESKKSEKR